MTKSGRLILWLILCVIGFLIAVFWLYPQLSTASARLENTEAELKNCRDEHRLSQLRDLAGLMYFEAVRQNYGVAATYSSRYFDALAEIQQAEQLQTPAGLQELSEQRDRITAALAQGSPTAVAELQQLFLETFRRTQPDLELLSPELAR